MNKFKAEKHIKQRYSEKTKLWSFQVFIDYKDDNEKRQSYTKTFSEKKYESAKLAFDAAKQHRNDIIKKISMNNFKKSKGVTVKWLFEKSKEVFIKRLETNRKKNIRYNKYIDPFCGNKEISKINAIDIYNTLNLMINECTNDTIQSVFTIWKEIFNVARILRVIDINITEEVIAPKSMKITKKKNVETSLDDLEKIIFSLRKHTRDTDEYKYNVELIIFGLRIIYETGIRPCECFALDKSDIDLNSNLFYINKELGSDIENKNVIRIPKTEDSERPFPINDKLKNIFIQLINFQDNLHLFAKWNGNYFNVNEVTNKISRCAKIDSLNFNMYMLRHLFSTDLITSGIDPRTVMELMGHNNIGMTGEYARSNNELKIKALEKRNMN